MEGKGMITVITAATIKVLMFGVMPCYMMCKSWELMLPIKEQPITVIKFKEWSVGK
jgi:hypothetical protein